MYIPFFAMLLAVFWHAGSWVADLLFTAALHILCTLENIQITCILLETPSSKLFVFI